MTKQEVSQCEYWLDTLINEAYELTEWEETFLDSIAGKLDDGMDLTQKQMDALEKIYTQKTSK